MRSSLGGTDGASACDSRVNAQQSRAGSELRELNVRYAEGLGSVELLIDRLRRGLSVVKSANQVLSNVLSDPAKMLST